LLVVVQNFLTSMLNSHIFDFHEGWMYVLGVGIAGGMVLKSKAEGAGAATGNGIRDGLSAPRERVSKPVPPIGC
jgi:hypothetical protein